MRRPSASTNIRSNIPNRDIAFECTRLKGTDKQGIIVPDSDGCYTQVIGGLNAYNSSEDFYELEAGLHLFQSMSSFQRRIARGVLRAEYGHPKMPIGKADKYDYGVRYARIEETMVCGTWRRIWLSQERLKDGKGRYIVPIMGTIYPSGPYGQALKHAFDSKGEQVCFSVRSFTRDTPRYNGTYIKRLVDIVTFDYVNEPGIWNAEKLLSPSLESLEHITVDADRYLKKLDNLNQVSQESDIIHVRESLLDIIKAESKPRKVYFSRW